MKKLFFTPFILFILFSCKEENIEGNWLVVKQDYNLSQIDPPDFQLLSIMNNKIYFDLDSSFYSIKNDSLFFRYKNDFVNFKIGYDGGDYMFLISNSYQKNGTTTLYLKKQ